MLSASEIGNLTQILDDAGTNQGQASFYEQLLIQKEQEQAYLESERQRSKEKSDIMLEMITNLNKHITTPKKVVRDEEGRVIGVSLDDQ